MRPKNENTRKMRATDKNIIMITAGGVGARFGSSVPKQYVEINGRQVISYVIEACRKSQEARTSCLSCLLNIQTDGPWEIMR